MRLIRFHSWVSRKGITGLNVENVLRVVVRPHPEVDVVLERHGNEIRDGILRLLGQVDVVLSPHRSRQH